MESRRMAQMKRSSRPQHQTEITGIKRTLETFAGDYQDGFSKYGSCTRPIYQEPINDKERSLQRNKMNLPDKLLRSGMAGVSLEETPLFDEKGLQELLAGVAHETPQTKAKRVRFCFSQDQTFPLKHDAPQPLRPILKPVLHRRPRPLRLAERACRIEDVRLAHSSPPPVTQPAPKRAHGIDSASVKRSLDMHLQRNGFEADAYKDSVLASAYAADVERQEAAEQMRKQLCKQQAAIANTQACFSEACKRRKTMRLGPQLHPAGRTLPLSMPRLGHVGRYSCARCRRSGPEHNLVLWRTFWHNANASVRECAACESRGVGVRPRIHLDTITPRSPSVFFATPTVAAPVAKAQNPTLAVTNTSTYPSPSPPKDSESSYGSLTSLSPTSSVSSDTPPNPQDCASSDTSASSITSIPSAVSISRMARLTRRDTASDKTLKATCLNEVEINSKLTTSQRLDESRRSLHPSTKTSTARAPTPSASKRILRTCQPLPLVPQRTRASTSKVRTSILRKAYNQSRPRQSTYIPNDPTRFFLLY
ncbi:hypothetical protein F503_04184 [Ophiostoma piceae UAMH 11346]|uniref:Uncharacterized protein n=1 Tax=Ophiostoma piceae (strain UAMH 11346) TaxID=1262450 RepID=S3C717_OPHP1|nr:hypothetical protein F503_04184 [Ophiostoma piceae UAMH 11346]